MPFDFFPLCKVFTLAPFRSIILNSKVEKLNRDELIYPTNSKNKTEREQNLPLVCDFNPALPPIGKILNQHKDIVELDPIFKKAIPTNKVFVSYRGNKAIKDFIDTRKRMIKIQDLREEHLEVTVFVFRCDCQIKTINGQSDH